MELAQYLRHSMALTCLLLQVGHATMSDSLSLLYQTNPDEFHDLPMKFTHPIPDWMRGIYIKNGMGQFEMGPRSLKHVFDGYAKVHSWKFMGNSSVYFTAKFIKTKSYKASLQLDNIAPYLLFLGPVPPFSRLERVQALLNGIDNTNVNVYQFGEDMENPEMVAISDFWHCYQFNISTLETLGKVSAAVPKGGALESLGLPLASSSHPLKEYGTTNTITFVSSMNPIPLFSSTIRLVRIKGLYKREQIAEITVDKVPYMHSFALSRKYAILFGQPIYTNLRKLMMTGVPLSSLEWQPEKPLILYVVNIRTGKVEQLSTKALFMMHHVNSFELNRNKIIIDAITYPDIEFVKNFQVEKLRDPVRRQTIPANASLRRFILNLRSSRVTVRDFPITPGVEAAAVMDFPAINENYRYRRYCYIYGLAVKADGIHLDSAALVKRDLCHKSRDRMWFMAGHSPTEPWFVPTPGATKEDGGVLLSIMYDEYRRRSYLAMFDAATMTRINMGYVPTIIPFSLHGRFFARPSNV